MTLNIIMFALSSADFIYLLNTVTPHIRKKLIDLYYLGCMATFAIGGLVQ